MQVQKIAHMTGHRAAIFTIIGGSSPSKILSGAGEGWVVEWDLEQPDMGNLLAKVESNIYALCYLKEQEYLVVGNMNGGIHWVNLANKADMKNIAHHQKGVYDIQHIDGHIWTLGGEGIVTKWNIETQRALESLQLCDQPLRGMAFSKSRQEIAIGASDNSIYFLDSQTFTLKHKIENAHENSVFCLHYTPDNQYLMSGGRDAHLRVWDLENNYAPISAQPAHWFTINHIAFHPNGTLFATASRDKTIKIWSVEGFKLLKVISVQKQRGHTHSVNKLYWSEHQNWLVSCGDDRTVMVWEVAI